MLRKRKMCLQVMNGGGGCWWSVIKKAWDSTHFLSTNLPPLWPTHTQTPPAAKREG